MAVMGGRLSWRRSPQSLTSRSTTRSFSSRRRPAASRSTGSIDTVHCSSLAATREQLRDLLRTLRKRAFGSYASEIPVSLCVELDRWS